MAAKKKKRKNAVPKGAGRSRSVTKAGVDIEQAPRDANALAALPFYRRLHLADALGIGDKMRDLTSVREQGVLLSRALLDWDGRRAQQAVGGDAAPAPKGSCNVAVPTSAGDAADTSIPTSDPDAANETDESASATFSELDITLIRVEPELQARVSLDPVVVSDYALSINSLPPVVVYFDGTYHFLADGHLRLAAHKKAKRQVVRAEVRLGTKRDAQLFAVGANMAHGLRRSRADKRRAVQLLLADSHWASRTSTWIAEHAGVSEPFVSKVRDELGDGATRRLAKNGRVLETKRIGRRHRTSDRREVEGAASAILPSTPAPRSHSKHLKSRTDSESSGAPRAPSADIASALLNLAESTLDRGLAPPVVELQHLMIGVVGVVRELHARFQVVLERAKTNGKSLLVVQGSGIEHQLRELERSLLFITPDRPCPSCQGGDADCHRCQGGRWIGRPANFDANATAETER